MPVPQGDNHEFRLSTPSTKERQVKPSTHLFDDFSATEEWCVWDGLRAIPCAPKKVGSAGYLAVEKTTSLRQAQVVLWSNSSSSRSGTGLCCVTRGLSLPILYPGRENHRTMPLPEHRDLFFLTTDIHNGILCNSFQA
jgi:hypothetical protein